MSQAAPGARRSELPPHAQQAVRAMHDVCVRNAHCSSEHTAFHSVQIPPMSIADYAKRVYKYSGCSDECFPMALSLMKRYLTRRSVMLTFFNIHRLLITAVMVTAKTRDDEYFSNLYYASIGGVTNMEMNTLELHLLVGVGWELWIDPAEYWAVVEVCENNSFADSLTAEYHAVRARQTRIEQAEAQRRLNGSGTAAVAPPMRAQPAVAAHTPTSASGPGAFPSAHAATSKAVPSSGAVAGLRADQQHRQQFPHGMAAAGYAPPYQQQQQHHAVVQHSNPAATMPAGSVAAMAVATSGFRYPEIQQQQQEQQQQQQRNGAARAAVSGGGGVCSSGSDLPGGNHRDPFAAGGGQSTFGSPSALSSVAGSAVASGASAVAVPAAGTNGGSRPSYASVLTRFPSTPPGAVAAASGGSHHRSSALGERSASGGGIEGSDSGRTTPLSAFGSGPMSHSSSVATFVDGEGAVVAGGNGGPGGRGTPTTAQAMLGAPTEGSTPTTRTPTRTHFQPSSADGRANRRRARNSVPS